MFLVTRFWKKDNENGTKTFEFNPWKKNSNDQDTVKPLFERHLYLSATSNRMPL